MRVALSISRRAPAASRIVPGIQLYTVRDLMANDVAGTLDAIARLGYREEGGVFEEAGIAHVTMRTVIG